MTVPNFLKKGEIIIDSLNNYKVKSAIGFCENAIETLKSLDRIITNLEQNNKNLKSKHYKDVEILKMKEKVDQLQRELNNAFTIPQSKKDELEKWENDHLLKKHSCKTPEDRMKFGGAVGGAFKYSFSPTAIGVFGTAKCFACGEEFDISDV